MNAVCVIWNCFQIAHSPGCSPSVLALEQVDAAADHGIYRGGFDGPGS